MSVSEFSYLDGHQRATLKAKVFDLLADYGVKLDPHPCLFVTGCGRNSAGDHAGDGPVDRGRDYRHGGHDPSGKTGSASGSLSHHLLHRHGHGAELASQCGVYARRFLSGPDIKTRIRATYP